MSVEQSSVKGYNILYSQVSYMPHPANSLHANFQPYILLLVLWHHPMQA